MSGWSVNEMEYETKRKYEINEINPLMTSDAIWRH